MAAHADLRKPRPTADRGPAKELMRTSKTVMRRPHRRPEPHHGTDRHDVQGVAEMERLGAYWKSSGLTFSMKSWNFMDDFSHVVFVLDHRFLADLVDQRIGGEHRRTAANGERNRIRRTSGHHLVARFGREMHSASGRREWAVPVSTHTDSEPPAPCCRSPTKLVTPSADQSPLAMSSRGLRTPDDMASIAHQW